MTRLTADEYLSAAPAALRRAMLNPSLNLEPGRTTKMNQRQAMH